MDPAGMVPLTIEIVCVPATAVMFDTVVQVVATFGGLAMVKLAGRVSVKLAPVYGEPVGFCNVMVRVVVPPAATEVGENALVRPTA